MSFCVFSPEKTKSNEIDKKIALWRKDYQKAIQILLLGML